MDFDIYPNLGDEFYCLKSFDDIVSGQIYKVIGQGDLNTNYANKTGKTGYGYCIKNKKKVSKKINKYGYAEVKTFVTSEEINNKKYFISTDDYYKKYERNSKINILLS